MKNSKTWDNLISFVEQTHEDAVYKTGHGHMSVNKPCGRWNQVRMAKVISAKNNKLENKLANQLFFVFEQTPGL